MYIEDFEVWMLRIHDRLDTIENKIDRLSNVRNCLDGVQLLDNQDLMMITKMSESTLARHRKSKKLLYLNHGGKNFYRPEDVHKFIREEL